jgi:type IV fimbrial biogenesis protein FimT
MDKQLRCRGFTLIELAIVLAIASILLGSAIPSFIGLVRSSRLTASTNDLLGSILLARAEAVKHRSRVALCKSTDGVSCAATGGWEQGWIVFHDTNNNGLHDAGEQVVWRAQPLADNLRLSGNLNVAKYISYSPTGDAKLTSGAFQAGTITLCNVSAAKGDARQIVISAAGRPRVQKATVASCA